MKWVVIALVAVIVLQVVYRRRQAIGPYLWGVACAMIPYLRRVHITVDPPPKA